MKGSTVQACLATCSNLLNLDLAFLHSSLSPGCGLRKSRRPGISGKSRKLRTSSRSGTPGISGIPGASGLNYKSGISGISEIAAVPKNCTAGCIGRENKDII